MLKEMNSQGPKLKKEDIKILELKFNIELPNDYCEFLLKYNGGTPVERTIDFDYEKTGVYGAEIGYFNGLNRKSDISRYIENLTSVLPLGLIPIADTPSGNYILLSTNKGTYGKVYFKDAEIEDSFEFVNSTAVLPESIILIANSFSEFLTQLYNSDE